ncbi:MAG: hypothetical protein ABI704_23710 [Kofleriaceae bacterium]
MRLLDQLRVASASEIAVHLNRRIAVTDEHGQSELLEPCALATAEYVRDLELEQQSISLGDKRRVELDVRIWLDTDARLSIEPIDA